MDRYKILFWISFVILIILISYILISRLLIGMSLSYNSVNSLYCCSPKRLPIVTPPSKITIQHFEPAVALYSLYLIDCVYYQDYQGQKPVLRLSFQNSIYGNVFRSENDTIWIVFRGTMTFSDAYFDTNVTQTKYNDPDVMVHKGFWEVYQGFRQYLLAFFSNHYSNEKIIITGHSLGAALAVFTALDLHSITSSLCVYTFGSPRIGNQSFSKLLKDLNVYRVSNTSDIITQTPLPITVRPFHPHDPFFYNHGAKRNIVFNDNRSSFAQNHSLSTYFDFVLHLKDMIISLDT